MNRRIPMLVATLSILALATSPEARAQKSASVRVPVADVYAGAARLDFVPRGASAGFVLTVSGPDGAVERQEHEAGRAVFFTVAGPDGGTRPDGVYTYELRTRRAAPAPFAGTPSGNETFDGRAAELESAVRTRPGTESAPLTGSFWIQNGQIVAGNAVEPRASRSAPAGAGRTPAAGRTPLDVVTADDAIIQGSLCVGLDCVNNESFGFDTIRLKENNTRIAFSDTSVGTFPANAWQLTANDSASGGANKFSIEDITGAKVPFTVTAGAATNSFFVDSTGRVGFRTATPVLDLHVNTSNTPALRLDQNNSGGFTAQTWDVAGNEANFFVRDVTGGSRLPVPDPPRRADEQHRHLGERERRDRHRESEREARDQGREHPHQQQRQPADLLPGQPRQLVLPRHPRASDGHRRLRRQRRGHSPSVHGRLGRRSRHVLDEPGWRRGRRTDADHERREGRHRHDRSGVPARRWGAARTSRRAASGRTPRAGSTS